MAKNIVKTDKLFVSIGLLLVSSFVLGGYMYAGSSRLQNNIVIEQEDRVATVVASKYGTTYHFPWCPGSFAMRKENTLYFTNPDEAERLGYRKAKTCKGL